jgi:hypothetical protein
LDRPAEIAWVNCSWRDFAGEIEKTATLVTL